MHSSAFCAWPAKFCESGKLAQSHVSVKRAMHCQLKQWHLSSLVFGALVGCGAVIHFRPFLVLNAHFYAVRDNLPKLLSLMSFVTVAVSRCFLQSSSCHEHLVSNNVMCVISLPVAATSNFNVSSRFALLQQSCVVSKVLRVARICTVASFRQTCGILRAHAVILLVFRLQFTRLLWASVINFIVTTQFFATRDN